MPFTLEWQREETQQQIASDIVYRFDRPVGDAEPSTTSYLCSSPLPAFQVGPAVHKALLSLQAVTMKDFVQITRPVPRRRTEMLDEQLITMIPREYHLLKLMEDVEFRKCILMLCPGYSLPNRKTLTESLLPKLYARTMESAKTKIEGAAAVCLATDGSTSVNNGSFIAVTAHFLLSSEKGLKMKSILLGCNEFNERHTSLILLESGK